MDYSKVLLIVQTLMLGLHFSQAKSYNEAYPESSYVGIKSAITHSGDQISEKLDHIIEALQYSNQKVRLHNFTNCPIWSYLTD